MPSDFISLLGADLDLNSPKSLYSKESVYDLLPKELQLPSSSESNPAAMTQKSGGEAGPPPPASLASDATSSSSSMPMGCPRTACPPSSSPTMHSPSCVTDQAAEHDNPAAGEGPSSSGVVRALAIESKSSGVEPDAMGCSSGGGNWSGGAGGTAPQPQQFQSTPSKRRTVLNISPPPEDLLDDSRMSSHEDPTQDSEQSASIWMDDSASNFSIVSSGSYNDNTEVPRKSRKRTPRQRPGPKPTSASEASMDVFDADSAKGPHFVLSQLASDIKACPKGSSAEGLQSSSPKASTLSVQYPAKSEGKELKILVQPETQHRARYLTEGSRGSVKDRTQQGFPTVKVEGVNEPVVLQVFVGNDAGRVKPHGFYQACRVTGRNTTACKEVDIDSTTVIEVGLDPSNNMTLAVDCVGILKLRNADVEARIGVAGSKKKSTRARLVFRVNIPRPDGSVLILQAPSSPILCTQPAGAPEILKKSLHSCSVKGGEEVFLIGKNFLKGAKVIFQENPADENSWQAEAEIDMELFHQNHLIVKVPPYQNQAINSPVSVGIFVVTNAGRSHDIQPFTYNPEPDPSIPLPATSESGQVAEVSVKKEVQSLTNPCSFKEQMKGVQSAGSNLDSAVMAPVIPLIKREEVIPMEVSSHPVAESIRSAQEGDMRSNISNSNHPFSIPMACQPREADQQAAIYTSTEPLSTMQKQDVTPTDSFSMPGEAILQQLPQQFLLKSEGLQHEESCSGPDTGVVGLLQIVETPEQQSQLPLFPQDGVAQLERAVRQLQAGGFSSTHSDGSNLVQQVLEAAAQQQLNQVLYNPTSPLSESMQQVQENISGQQLQSAENSLMKEQQQEQQQVLEDLQKQLQSELFQPDISMQCGIFQDDSQTKTPQQQSSAQAMAPDQGPFFHSAEGLHCTATQHQQEQTHQHQEQAALFQQAEELLSIQTSSFLQQPPANPSPPQQLFHNSSQLTNTQGSLFLTQKASPTQEQVQAVIFQNTLTVLTSSTLSSDQQSPAPGIFLPQGALPSQLSADSSQQPQQQQMAFLDSMATSASNTQSGSVFPSQLPPIEQNTPMGQQLSSQQPQQQGQSMFQNLSAHPPSSTLSPSQQQQQTGLLYCASTLSTQEQSPSMIFESSGPSQESQSPALLFYPNSVVSVSQQETTEPMSYQDQSSIVENQPVSEPQQQSLFEGQQPMQVVPSSGSSAEAPVTIFMPQSAISVLQGSLSSQDLTQATIFSTQNETVALQTSTSSAVQQQASPFQTTVNMTTSQSSQDQQPGIFLFAIQNECGQLISSSASALSSHHENDAPMQSLLNQPASISGDMQDSVSTSQNIEKIDDLLESLQEQGNNISRSF
ncbi:nuclear factor of activated T-cells 5-like isoform X1 [Scleropages formosus]|uniref:Nuclear factor of activated T-cells 5 n=2 Tax=Scleropages formosus TaxID=113540 RepID=A0A8C9SFB9_SCLFO|nr:nuclear factor of activated T-cells 5-like isoform X1 [Scleropages formosus]